MSLSELARRKLATALASTSEANEIGDAVDAISFGALAAKTDGITATAGGTQATTPALTSRVNRVSTVATALDAVKLPLAVGGQNVVVVNDTSKAITVYGAGTDTINDVAFATGVVQGPFSCVEYQCTTTAAAGKYYSGQQGVGFSGDALGSFTPSAPINLSIGASTAAAGTTTSDAGALPAGTANVYPTTAANDTKGVVIHAADKVTGRTIIVGNGVANKILKIYPPSGGTINGGSADAAFSTVSGAGATIVCLSGSGNTWFAQ